MEGAWLQARIAARQDDAESLNILTGVLRRSIRGLDEQGRTLLYYAVRGNRDDAGQSQPSASVARKLQGADAQWDDVPRYLVNRQQFDVNVQAGSGMTPLMEAARFGSLDSVRLLLELRADPGLRNARGDTALEVARSRVPEYLDFKEMQCSETRWAIAKEHVDKDRSRIAEILQCAG
ncbi:unnamed protein product [Effrenium voratum]|nr:unnamed protein product [Effrenium voratum]